MNEAIKQGPEAARPALSEELALKDLQILPETGISADYMNDFLFFKEAWIKRVLNPHIIPGMYSFDDAEKDAADLVRVEKKVRELLMEKLPRLESYTDFVEGHLQLPIFKNLPREKLLQGEVAERVQQIDQKVSSMKAMYNGDPQSIDLAAVQRLAFEVMCLILGDSQKAQLKKQFFEMHPHWG